MVPEFPSPKGITFIPQISMLSPSNVEIYGKIVPSFHSGGDTVLTDDAIKENFSYFKRTAPTFTEIALNVDIQRIINFQNAIHKYTTAQKFKFYFLDVVAPALATLASVVFIICAFITCTY